MILTSRRISFLGGGVIPSLLIEESIYFRKKSLQDELMVR